jgi:hypothetical protein
VSESEGPVVVQTYRGPGSPSPVIVTFDRDLEDADLDKDLWAVSELGVPLTIRQIIATGTDAWIELGDGYLPDRVVYSGGDPLFREKDGGPHVAAFDSVVPWP